MDWAKEVVKKIKIEADEVEILHVVLMVGFRSNTN
jgi:hypothetical protein